MEPHHDLVASDNGPPLSGNNRPVAPPTAAAPIDQPVTNPFVDASLIAPGALSLINTSPRGVRFFGNVWLRCGGLAGLRCGVDRLRLGLGGRLGRGYAAAAPGCDFPGLGAPDFASPQFAPMCGSTNPLSGAPENVSEKASIIDCLRIAAARSA